MHIEIIPVQSLPENQVKEVAHYQTENGRITHDAYHREIGAVPFVESASLEDMAGDSEKTEEPVTEGSATEPAEPAVPAAEEPVVPVVEESLIEDGELEAPEAE
jgi:hypothetical protein